LPIKIGTIDIAKAHKKAQGHRRRLERIYGMKRYLSRKILEYGKAEMELSEILDGPVDHWDSQL